MQVDPPLAHPQPGARAAEVRLDEAHEHAVAVGRAHVDRAAVGFAPRAGDHRALRIDGRAPRRDPVVAEQTFGRDRHRVGVAEVLTAVGKRELHRFDQEVLAVRAVGTEVEAVDDPHRLERGDALRRRGHLEDLDVAHVRPQRLDPCAGVRGDVGGSHATARALQAFRDRVADRAAVVRIGTVVGEGADRARELGLAHPVAGLDVAVVLVEVGETEVVVEERAVREEPGAALGQREALLRVVQRAAGRAGRTTWSRTSR